MNHENHRPMHMINHDNGHNQQTLNFMTTSSEVEENIELKHGHDVYNLTFLGCLVNVSSNASNTSSSSHSLAVCGKKKKKKVFVFPLISEMSKGCLQYYWCLCKMWG